VTIKKKLVCMKPLQTCLVLYPPLKIKNKNKNREKKNEFINIVFTVETYKVWLVGLKLFCRKLLCRLWVEIDWLWLRYKYNWVGDVRGLANWDRQLRRLYLLQNLDGQGVG